MFFDWDTSNIDHIAKHQITPEEAEQVLQGEPIDLELQGDEDDDIRYTQIGETEKARILVVVSTDRGPLVRVITAWDAPKAYKDYYLAMRSNRQWTVE